MFFNLSYLSLCKGGPLVIRGKDSNGADDIQVGLVSWGVGCASKHFPGVYARISEAYDWIQDEVCSKSQDPPANLCGGGGGGSSPKPPSPSPPSPPSPSGGGNGKWRTVLWEDFQQGYGSFQRGGRHAKFLKSKQNRSGIVGIQNGKGLKSSFYSQDISVSGNSDFKVTFSYMAVAMEDDDSFCLDYSTDSGKKWKQVECWSGSKMPNKVWVDDVSVEFSDRNNDEINIRFRCDGNSNKDDILIDSVKVEAK